jgi:hypothetical protein
MEALPQLQTADPQTGYRLKVFDIWGTPDWAVGELALVDEHGAIVPSNGSIVIAWKGTDDHWAVSVKGTEDFNRRLEMIPDKHLAPSTKQMLYVPAGFMTTLGASSGIYKLPFACNVSANVTWVHSDAGQVYDIDFEINGQDIVAARDGWIAQIVENHNECCYNSVCEPCNNYVVINHGYGEYSYYLHIKQWSVPGNLSVGTFVQQGDKIAEQGDVGWTGGSGRDDVPCNGKTYDSRCGIHLHFGVHKGPYWNSTTVQPRFQDVYDSYGTWYVSAGQFYQSGNCGGGGGPQVKLYSQANYGGSTVFSGGIGFSNAPNADSYSMEIPSGWSVKTWRGDNRSGEGRFWCQSVSNLQDHGWHLAIQSIEVFDSDCPQPPPPRVKLWSLANYQGSTVFSGGTGFSNDPNANSYSMEIPGGWSVKTWRGDNRSGEERCWSQSVPNLQDHGWHLAIQSIEVFDSDACPMRLNFTTGLGHQAEVEIVVTSVGDPDDQLSQNNVTTDSQGNGSVELSGCVVPGKNYDIYAKPYLYLRQEKSMTLQPGTNSVTFDSPFKKGDIINDNSIGVMDLLYLLNNWGTSDPKADLTEMAQSMLRICS